MAVRNRQLVERLLSVAEVAELLGTSERFPRRLIAERRIEFIRVGRHVRIPESALVEFIKAGRVEPLTVASVRTGREGRRDGQGKQARTSAFRQHSQASVWSLSGQLPRAGRAAAERSGYLRAQE